MAKRAKLQLPAEWLELVRLRQEKECPGDRELAKRAGVSNASIHRMKKGEGSWDTVAKVAAALSIEAPYLVAPDSPAGLLEKLRRSNPASYTRALEKLLGGGFLVEAALGKRTHDGNKAKS